MKLNENKAKEQSIVLQKWKEAGFVGTWVAFTGVGKTRVGTIAASEFIRRDPTETSLVVVPTENLRDNEWENSFATWGYLAEKSRVDIMCIQTARKLIGKHYNTLIIDEYHTTLTEKYTELFENNTFDRIFCLTATLNDDKKAIADKYAKVIWETPRERAIALKLVSESIVYNYGIELTKEERDLYTRINERYLEYETALGGNKKAFDQSNRYLRLKGVDRSGSNMRVYTPENRAIYATEMNDVTLPSNLCRELTSSEVVQLKQKVHEANMYWKYMRERRLLVTTASNKVDVVKQLCDRYPDRRGIIFSEGTAFADKISATLGDKCGTYHSKMTKVDRTNDLQKFLEGLLQWMSSVKALNAGTDVPDISLGIATGGDSKSLNYIQRNGRVSRYVEDKISYYFNLYAINTQEINWIRSGTKTLNPKWILSLDELPLN